MLKETQGRRPSVVAYKQDGAPVAGRCDRAQVLRDLRSESVLDYDCDYLRQLKHCTNEGYSQCSRKRTLERDSQPGTSKRRAKMHKCSSCPASEEFTAERESLIIARSHRAYVALMPRKWAVTPYHMEVVPTSHVSSVLKLDEDQYCEVRNYMKAVVQFLDGRGLAPLFLETVTRVVSVDQALLNAGPHTTIEVIPVPIEVLESSKGHFKKALDEAGQEWRCHKTIQTFGRRHAPRRCIPEHFPYLHVDFSLSGGFASVIEEERTPKNFLRDIAAGVLDLCPFERQFKDDDSFADYRAKTITEFAPFDWGALT
ncbi:MAG: hypothetical protein KVP17_004577 [Porospora cf. gigantea B]|nr:MAG: hypothetical protein KVP17_004577 [Porospora cf. gigantea B]